MKTDGRPFDTNTFFSELKDPNFPNEVWKKYEYYTKPGQCINPKVMTDYWISTYGRCYSSKTNTLLKPYGSRTNTTYAIRINDEYYYLLAYRMIAETFIPNYAAKPHIIIIDKNKQLHVGNVAWSYDKYVLSKYWDELDKDLRVLYDGSFELSKQDMWKELIVDGVRTNYIISRMGKVYNNISKDILTGTISEKGYRRVCLTISSNEVYMAVHRLVAEAFIPNPDNKPEVNHINGNKLNCEYWNLEWVTRKENNDHAWRTGLSKAKCDDKHPRSKFSNAEVECIRKEFKEGKSVSELSKTYGVLYITMYQIVKGTSYRGVAK